MGQTTCSHTHLFGFDLSPLYLKEFSILLDCKFKPFLILFVIKKKKNQKENFKIKNENEVILEGFQNQK
jgi:hypothetical protein